MKPQGTCCVREYKGIDIERRVNYPGAINRGGVVVGVGVLSSSNCVTEGTGRDG